MYNSINAIATAGKTRPVKGTRTDGRKDAAIVKPPEKIILQFKTSLLQIAPS
jgi:hypothetical protein